MKTVLGHVIAIEIRGTDVSIAYLKCARGRECGVAVALRELEKNARLSSPRLLACLLYSAFKFLFRFQSTTSDISLQRVRDTHLS